METMTFFGDFWRHSIKTEKLGDTDHVHCHPQQQTTCNKQLLHEVFVICGIVRVEVSVISRDEGRGS